MTSRDWLSSERPPGGTEYNYARANVKSFPKIPNGFNVKSFSQPNGCNVKSFSIKSNTNTNHLQTEVDGYFKSMIMNGVSRMPHSKENESYLLDLMIDEAANNLSKKAEPFKKETDECFNVTQLEINAMV